jgi:hypothetical protein
MSLIQSAVNPHKYVRAEPKSQRLRESARDPSTIESVRYVLQNAKPSPEAAHLSMRGVSCADGGAALLMAERPRQSSSVFLGNLQD